MKMRISFAGLNHREFSPTKFGTISSVGDVAITTTSWFLVRMVLVSQDFCSGGVGGGRSVEVFGRGIMHANV